MCYLLFTQKYMFVCAKHPAHTVPKYSLTKRAGPGIFMSCPGSSMSCPGYFMSRPGCFGFVVLWAWAYASPFSVFIHPVYIDTNCRGLSVDGNMLAILWYLIILCSLDIVIPHKWIFYLFININFEDVLIDDSRQNIGYSCSQQLFVHCRHEEDKIVDN